MSTETRNRLIEIATDAVRRRGYHAVSFRDLAGSLGIKSASVHYHFPQKEDLGAAIVADYATAYFAELERRTHRSSTPTARLRAMRDVYRDALGDAELHCLCGMLGAEARGLPDALRGSVNAFFEANVAWVREALPPGVRDRRSRARQFVATLQGAMMLAGSLDDASVFDDATSRLLRDAGGW